MTSSRSESSSSSSSSGGHSEKSSIDTLKNVTSSSSRTSPPDQPMQRSATVKWSDLLDPIQYELQTRQLRRATAAESWGMEVTTVSPDVIELSGVKKDEVAETSGGLTIGAYVMALNGKRITNIESAKAEFECNRLSIRVALAVRRRAPLDPKAPIELPRGWTRKPGAEYFFVRLDPTNQKRVGAAISMDRGGRAYISTIQRESAAATAGLRAEDRILTVNGTEIIARHQILNLVKDMQGNPFDLLVERTRSDASGQYASKCSNMMYDKEGGEPSVGVPECPTDVIVLLESKTKEVLRSVLSRSEAESVTKSGAKKSLRVKLKKEIKKDKLKRDNPGDGKKK